MRILITGNSSGIGAAIQRELHSNGHLVVEGTHDLIGGKRRYDVANEDDMQEMIDNAVTFDVLINNAGILDEEPFGRLTMAGMERILRVNFIAPMLLSQLAVGAGAKLIINIGSYYGVSGAYGVKPTYAASKAALHNATLSLARFLGPRGVRVVGIAPGIVDTGIHRGQGGIEKHGTGHSSIGRLGTVAEVASAVRHVIENSYINGTIIEVHGGR